MSARQSLRASLWAPALVLLATALVYLPSLRNGFVNWDDEANLLHNASYRGLSPAHLRWMFTTFHMGHYQPLAWVSLGADYVLWGMNPFGYHLTSLLFHVVNAGLVYLLAMRLIGRSARARAPEAGGAPKADSRTPLAAAFAAGLFALHPLRVESVAWATERRDVLSGTFFLLATLAHVAAVDAPDARRRLASRTQSILLFAGALLSKSITVTLPALLLVLDVYPLRRHRRGETARSLLLEKAPYALLALVAAIVAVLAQRTTQFLPSYAEIGPLERVGIAVVGLGFYVWKTLVPLGLSATHTLPVRAAPRIAIVVGSALLVLGASAAAWRLRRRWPAVAAAWVAYGIALIPVLGIFQVWTYIAADRYSYVPCLGLALLGGAALARFGPASDAPRRGARAPLLAAGVLAVLALLTLRQIPAWHDSESLWRHAIAVNHDSHIAHYNLGIELARQGRLDEARAAYHEALRARPGYSEAQAALGALTLKEGRTVEAIAELREAIRSWPANGEALVNLGVALAREGKREEALACYEEARLLRPDLAELHLNRGGLLLEMGRASEASDAFREAVRLRPDLAGAWKGLGIAAERQGDFGAAAAAYGEALRLLPGDAEARRSHAVSLLRAGDAGAALAAAREGLARDPRDLALANVLAWILATSPDASLRDGGEAVRAAEAALAAAGSEPDPNLLDTHAAALAEAGRFEDAARAARAGIERARTLGDSALASEIAARLALYERREPFRDRAAPR